MTSRFMPGTPESIRAATEADAVDGVVPRFVVEPESAEAVALVLAGASRERLSVVIRGGGTRLGWGRTPSRVDLVVATARVNRVVAHQHGDLTATFEAGATIQHVNAELARHRQWLPIDSDDPGETIGGAVATNHSGPRRQRYGTPRDLLIGIHLALTDGRLVKAGGNVVKNVAGYDLGKLISGSFGSLAAITSATFKLSPMPAASATAVAAFADSESLARTAAAIGASQLEPSAFDVHAWFGRRGSVSSAHLATPSPLCLLVQFASTRMAVDAQIGAARALMPADSFEVVDGAAEGDLWRRCTTGLWSNKGLIVRLSWLPANLGRVMQIADDLAQQGATTVELAGRAGVGAGFLRIEADAAPAVAAVARLRAEPAAGNIVVLRADSAVKRQLDVWGPLGDREKLLAAVKKAFDPEGILNAGRGPI
jgi:glycolate oxidase FAD binding subunit